MTKKLNQHLTETVWTKTNILTLMKVGFNAVVLDCSSFSFVYQ